MPHTLRRLVAAAAATAALAGTAAGQAHAQDGPFACPYPIPTACAETAGGQARLLFLPDPVITERLTRVVNNSAWPWCFYREAGFRTPYVQLDPDGAGATLDKRVLSAAPGTCVVR